MPTWPVSRLLGSSARRPPPDNNISAETLSSSPSSPPSSLSHPRGARPSPHGRSKSHHLSSNLSPPSSDPQPIPPLALRRSEGDLGAAEAVERTLPGTRTAPPKRAVSSTMSNSHPTAELVTGQCMCCDSTVRWPLNLTHFRCTICMTVNDLNPAKFAPVDDADISSRKFAASPMSISTIKGLIDASVEDFLNDRRLQGSPHFPEKERPSGGVDVATLGEPHQRVPKIPDPILDDPTVPPSRPPPPPPPLPPDYGGIGLQGPWSETAAARSRSRAAKLFKPIKNYLQEAFGDWECLNSSFVASSGTYSNNAIDPPNDEMVQPPRDNSDVYIPVTEKPGEKEALMLTVGRATRRGWANSRNERGSKSHESRLSVRVPPGIDWDIAREFYDIVLDAGKGVLSSLDASQDPPTDTDRYDEIAIDNARIDTLKVLLKTTENILKRPGRPLRRPEDIRFLLVIIANPLLYPGGAKLATDWPSPIAASLETQALSQRLPKPSSQKALPSNKDNIMGGPGYHSGLLKRLFGLLSSLPNECHHFLITWFSVMPERYFRPLVELGGSFTTYRITRQDNKTPSRGTSGLRGKLPYSDDWQIKATARVMSLLDKANNNSLGRRRHMRFLSASGASSTVSVSKQDMYRRGQIIPSNSFYNMRLDYCDLIADYDVWESKVAKFCFCQYPFFLSMGAKIQILEHEARRQMEVQARNAFLTNLSNRTALSQYMVLKVRRECLVEDSLKGISESSGTPDDLKKGLRVEFLGEEGIDAGGLKKEWFLMVAREVFDPNHGLFVYDEDSRYCYFNPHSFESSEEFYLVGVLLGLAIYNSTILDITLPSYVFRKLIYFAPHYSKSGADARSRPTFRRSLEDLAVLRPALAIGLQKLLDFEGDVQETFYRDFVAETERYGEKIVTPLCPDGENRAVTNTNRKEFVDLYLKYILDTSVSRQFEPFKRGFYTVCGGNALSLFGPDEIELLVRGSAEPLDIQALKAVAIYDGWGLNNAPDSDTVVKWFWNFFDKISPGEQRMLLSFITGSDRIPAMGATNLIIKVVCLGQDCDRFPVARTCFNQICLWRYKRREKLERLLWRAVTESEGFGLK